MWRHRDLVTILLVNSHIISSSGHLKQSRLTHPYIYKPVFKFPYKIFTKVEALGQSVGLMKILVDDTRLLSKKVLTIYVTSSK